MITPIVAIAANNTSHHWLSNKPIKMKVMDKANQKGDRSSAGICNRVSGSASNTVVDKVWRREGRWDQIPFASPGGPSSVSNGDLTPQSGLRLCTSGRMAKL